jgi:hypothetical protein
MVRVVTPIALSQFLLGLAGVAYGTALFIEPGVLRKAASRVVDVETREPSPRVTRLRRVAGVALVAAGMWLLGFSWPA